MSCFYFIVQDERYKKYIGKMAVVPLSGGREIPIIADEVFSWHEDVSFVYIDFDMLC